MQKRGLRGLLLGVSLALLLSGGVAMAAASLRVEPWCGVCCDAVPADLPEGCDDFWTMTTSGWGASESLTFTWTSPGPTSPLYFPTSADENGQLVVAVYLMCWQGNDFVHASADGYDWIIALSADWTQDDYGMWDTVVQGAQDSAQANFYFAEDPGVCRAMEFVPEPGSMLLLGSGLAGLAGYAALRLRSGQALRHRGSRPLGGRAGE
jgi:hypothetical protein